MRPSEGLIDESSLGHAIPADGSDSSSTARGGTASDESVGSMHAAPALCVYMLRLVYMLHVLFVLS
jgi:hypothetical protein